VHQVIWKDKNRFIDAYMYLQDVYQRLLQKMAASLDEVHGEQHGFDKNEQKTTDLILNW
jgi:hypothetical protein